MASRSGIVIGGGVAGVKVKIVERDDRVGGRKRSERIDGYIVDVAADLMPDSYKAVYRLPDDAGLPTSIAPD